MIEDHDSTFSPSIWDQDQNQYARLAFSVLNTLQSWEDHGYVIIALSNIKQHFKNEIFQDVLASRKIENLVINAMDQLSKDPAVQMLGCQLLNMFIEENMDLKNSLYSSDAYRHIIRVLHENEEDPALQLSALKILEKLVAIEEVLDQIIIDEYNINIADEMFSSLHKFPRDKEVVTVTYEIIKHLLEDEDDDIRDICLYSDNMQTLLEHFSTVDDQEIVVKVAEILIYLCVQKQREESRNYRQRLIKYDIHYLLLRRLQQNSDENITQACLRCLMLLVKEDNVKKFMFDTDYMKNDLLPTINQWLDNQHIQKAGLQIFNALAIDFGSIFLKNDEFIVQWCKTLYKAMSRHLEDPLVQAYGCQSIALMIEQRHDVVSCIGENTEETNTQEPIHTMCMGALLMHRKDSKVFKYACNAIYWLAADNARLSRSLIDKNVHTVVMDGLKLHINYPKAAESGLKAIRGLCIFNTGNKKRILSDESILSMISLIMDKFPQDLSLQLEAISALACIADVDTVRYQCFLEDVHIKVIHSLERFIDNEIIQEAGFECLSILCAADNAAEMLNMAGGARHVVYVMKKYSEMVYLQKKGLILIQLLAEKKICRDIDLCNDLADVICNSLTTHSDNENFLKEACVAVQLLSEIGKDITSCLIDKGCHRILFNILQAHDGNKELHDLICECLYVMGLTQDMKSKMLCTCEKGVLIGAECLLELGADVNYVDGDTTPLCHAVKNQDEDLVRLFLRHDISNLQKPLKLSLEIGKDTDEGKIITGHILGHIMDRTGKQALWNNLGLESLEPDWITIAFAKLLRTQSDFSKQLVNTIKGSHDRKKKRLLAYTKSDSDIMKTYGRHKFFRYKVKSDSETTYEQSKHSGKALNIRVAEKLSRSKSDSVLKSRRISTQALSPIVSPRLSEEWLDAEKMLKDENNTTVDIVHPVFELSEKEEDEWKSTTLTGANVPYNPADPRHIGSTDKLTVTDKPTGTWSRKSRSPSPRMFRRRSFDHLDRSATDESLVFLPVQRKDAIVDSNLEKRINECLGSRSSSIDTLISDSESRRSSMVLTNSIDITLLDVSSNKITDIQNLAECGTGFWSKFTCLQKINIGFNRLEQLPEEIFTSLTCLRQFEAKHNYITEVPVSLLQLEKLKHLDLSDNKISKIIPEKDLVNKSLQFLEFSGNDITELPKFSEHFPSLTHLHLQCNKIYTLPEQPLNLTDLKVLELANNFIKRVPEKFLHGCSKLDALDLENNEIESLPRKNIQDIAPKLTKLKLKKNKLCEKDPLFIPKFVLELPNLRKLDISDNEITNFPAPVLWRSQMLQEIKISRNRITKLNLEGCKAWAKLETLAVDSNNLAELPKDIGQVTSLTSLDISYNEKLKTLPDELGRCSRMWEFRYKGVELNLDRSLLNGRVKDLISFLHNKLKKATAYFRMKIMVVGYGGRGKSTLLRALMRVPKPAANNTPTVGIIVKDWVFERYRKEEKRKVVYTLNAWDFAGQEEFYSTHQCYLSNRALYLVVIKMNGGLTEIDKIKPWLSSIHARAPGCPVIVIGTHYDKIHKLKRADVVSEFIQKLNEVQAKPGFPSIQDFCPVDSSLEKENTDLDVLREKIKDIIDNYKVKDQPVMGQMVPASYVKLSDKLLEEARSLLKKSYPIIRHHRLLKIVKQSNIDLDEEELKQAIRFLHEFGVLLHYEDASLHMKDLYFIDPGWLCRMMAQVITVRQINPFIKNGILRKSDTKLLFSGKKVDKELPFMYPPELIPQYLKLLEKFEIALPHSETELLIPCYLPEKSPTLQLPVLDRNAKICRYYIMPYAQLGLWPRLITRLIMFSTSTLTKMLLENKSHPNLNYWKQGVCSVWSETVFFLVEFHSKEKEEIHVTVPNTQEGAGLLGLLVDHLDSLIEEWYPGLTTVDPYLGRELLEKLAPCVECNVDNAETILSGSISNEQKGIKMFRVDDLLNQIQRVEQVICDVHNGVVEISKLAPELVFMDINPELRLDKSKFEFDESEDRKLGDGGYGAVYRATYKSRPVAVKIFAAIGDVHPLKMLRQEATLLRCLKHPSVVSLLGVGVNPNVMVLELATHLSLGHVLKQHSQLESIIQYKIALQVVEGLAYLHKMMIVYRDMKPDNVLIFSLDSKALINAKISDYGIARFSMLDGLMLQEGTLAYRAPEVIRGEIYSFKADVFSYGITLYSLLTNGKHPFSEYEFKGEMDKAIVEGAYILPITEKGAPPWPGMQSLLLECLHQGPDQRPESSAIHKRLLDPEVLNLKQKIPLTKGLTVEYLTVQNIEKGKLCLWAASGNSECAQLSKLDFSLQHNMEPKGSMFKFGRILCLLALKKDYLLIGTEERRIWVLNTNTMVYEHSTIILPDAVLCMKHITGSKDDVVFAGLANGTVALLLLSELLMESQAVPMCLSPGTEKEVIRCMEYSPRDKRLYASCGSRILILSTRNSISVERKVETGDQKRPVQIHAMVVGSKRIYFSHAKSSVIHSYSVGDLKPKHSVDIKTIFDCKKELTRISSLALQDSVSTLWIGTGDGHIALVDVKTFEPIIMIHKYSSPVRSLLVINDKVNPVVISAGLGLQNKKEDAMYSDYMEEHYGCLCVWDGHFTRNIKQQQLDTKERQLLLESYITQM